MNRPNGEQKEAGKRAGVRENFDDEKYFKNISAIRKANLNFYVLFNGVMIFLLLLLYASTFVSEYARSMKIVYIAFIGCCIAELVLIYCKPFKDDTWIMPMCYFGVTKAYLFCLLTSVVYNRHAPAITFYVFLILIPVCFTFRIKIMLFIQVLVTVIFCISVAFLKDPFLILSDEMNCCIFMLIGIIMAIGSIRMRVDLFDMYRRADILEKSNREIFDTTPCGVLQMLFTETDVTVRFANKTAIEMCGYEHDEFWARKNWTIADIVFPEDIPLMESSLRNSQVGDVDTYDFRMLNKATGKYHWVSCKSLITKVENGTLTILSNLLDVDEKKRAESESEAKSRFLSRMSHEIRTPINAIMGMAELERQELASNSTDKGVLENYANETTAASQYLLTLVNDILDTSRIENDKIELQNTVINVEKYLRDVTNLIKPLADSKNIIFICERETSLGSAYIGDGVRGKQILVNILNNAIKFTPSGGTVTLKARGTHKTEKTTTLEFTITDTGIGMTEEFQKKLFQPFAQEDSASTSPFAGTGLGLNIAKALARKMNGDIVCHSEQGKGSTFVVTIVAGNATDEEAKERAEEVKQVSWDFTGLRILLCEDHPLNQKITRALLTRNHCEVDIAGNGAEGVELMEQHPAGYYSMILMDIRMPVMDGLEATAAIRNLDHPDARDIPIVAMSANAFPEDIRKSLEAGMDAHLAKPVDATILNNTIAHFTGRDEESQKKIKRPTVLIVDDIEMNAAIIANILKREYTVLTASNGRKALEVLEENPNIIGIITDIQMPEMDGIQLIHAIRENYAYDHIAILANTQYDTKTKTEQLLAMGADDFISKAASPTILANRLRNVLARYKS